MEDKEREFYFQWITQLMQYNMQLMNNMMQLSMQMVSRPPISAMSPAMSPNLSAFIPSPQDIDKIMKSMMGKTSNADDEKLT